MRIVRIATIGVVGLGLWWFVRHLDGAKLGAALGSARVWPLVVAATLNFVCLWGKALCWRIMLLPRYRLSQLRLFRYTIATFAASAIAPMRAGEVLRVWVLRRREGVPAADSSAVAVAEKLIDAMTLVVLVAPVPWLLSGLPSWVGTSIAVCASVSLVVFVVLHIAVGRIEATPASSVMRRFVAGMHVLRSPQRLAAAAGAMTFVWLADLGQLMLVLYALGIALPIAGGLLILFAINLTIVVPSTPAQVGALEVGALAACELLGIRSEPALAFALLYHALQVIPLIIVGIAIEFRLVLGREPAASAEP